MSETRPHVNPYLRPEPLMDASRLLSALCYPLLPQTAVSFKKAVRLRLELGWNLLAA